MPRAKRDPLDRKKEQILSRLRSYSLITPFFISTFHSGLGFFRFTQYLANSQKVSTPLEGFVDLLVVDEAGQVSPEIGVPTFALAQKALVVGDTAQIEPVWNVTNRGIDENNARWAKLIKTPGEYEDFLNSCRGVTNGSLMHLAQGSSLFRYPGESPVEGTMLTEHRRCAPRVIEFCNKYVYGGLLKVKTSTFGPLELPPLGYCHVPGRAEKFAGSWRNLAEARGLALWLAKMKAEFTEKYKKSLGEIVGIVTPFRPQKYAIEAALREQGIDPTTLVVGTVHALQGAERPIVVFSSVYGRGTGSTRLFFDSNFSMLNVAVSRAQHHFFVFGTIGLFNRPTDETPRAFLGRLLFREPENELSNDFLVLDKEAHIRSQIDFESAGSGEKAPKRLSTLEDHRRSLHHAIKIAEKRVIITSPFISDQAIEADELFPLIQERTQAGIQVWIITDSWLDYSVGTLKPASKRGRQLLLDAGARLFIVPGMHSKALIVDDSILIEGSFNWLSAVRDKNSPYARKETSMVTYPRYSLEPIREALEEMEEEFGIGPE